MIKNYIQKMYKMLEHQRFKCTGCGDFFYGTYFDTESELFYGNLLIHDHKIKVKLDFAHNLSNTKHNQVNYTKFIHSMLNASVQCNPCNVSHKRFNGKKFFTPEQAKRYEYFLDRHPLINIFVNCEGF
jgi:hypothetical protein